MGSVINIMAVFVMNYFGETNVKIPINTNVSYKVVRIKENVINYKAVSVQ